MSGSSTAAADITVAGTARAVGAGVRLREDAPLKSTDGSGPGLGQGGLRGVCACFAVLSVGVSVALLLQVGAGTGAGSGHGAVAGEGARCAEGGAAVLRAGGGALQAAVASVLCAVVQAPHRAGLLAPGRLLIWQYTKRSPPATASWPRGAGPAVLHRFHSRNSHGLSWRTLLQPAVDLASEGFPVSRSLAWWARETAGMRPTENPESVSRELAHLVETGALREGVTVSRPVLAAHLRALQNVSDDEWAASWNNTWLVEGEGVADELPGGWRLYGAGEGLGSGLAALLRGGELPAGEPRSGDGGAGVAVVAPGGVYAVLAVGRGAAGCVLVQTGQRCGERYIAAGGGIGALLRVAARLLGAGGTGGDSLAAAVEAPRGEGDAVNLVRQKGDELAAHADSRGLGVAARF